MEALFNQMNDLHSLINSEIIKIIKTHGEKDEDGIINYITMPQDGDGNSKIILDDYNENKQPLKYVKIHYYYDVIQKKFIDEGLFFCFQYNLESCELLPDYYYKYSIDEKYEVLKLLKGIYKD